MTVSSRIALGFAILRGFQLAALTVPWLLQKVRRADATESERSLVLMIGSRSILLGLAIVALGQARSLAAARGHSGRRYPRRLLPGRAPHRSGWHGAGRRRASPTARRTRSGQADVARNAR